MNTVIDSDGRPRTRPPRIFASLLILIGLVLGAGGAQLVSLGGSPYYLITGLALIVSGVLLWRAHRWGAYLYGLVTLGTIIWAVIESGFDGWALAPRVLPFLVLGLLLLRPKVRRALSDGEPRSLFASALTWGAIVLLIGLTIGVAIH